MAPRSNPLLADEKTVVIHKVEQLSRFRLIQPLLRPVLGRTNQDQSPRSIPMLGETKHSPQTVNIIDSHPEHRPHTRSLRHDKRKLPKSASFSQTQCQPWWNGTTQQQDTPQNQGSLSLDLPDGLYSSLRNHRLSMVVSGSRINRFPLQQFQVRQPLLKVQKKRNVSNTLI